MQAVNFSYSRSILLNRIQIDEINPKTYRQEETNIRLLAV